jgi:hypothetical protein
MSLSGTRLKNALATDINTQLTIQFPVNVSLLAAEQALYTAGQQKIADAIANAAGPDVVTEITGHAAVPGIQPGVGATVVT